MYGIYWILVNQTQSHSAEFEVAWLVNVNMYYLRCEKSTSTVIECVS